MVVDHVDDVQRFAVVSELADVVVCGENDVDLSAVRADLAARGFTRTLCEGGPTLFASMAAAGVVAHLELNKGQPMLSRDEEAIAVSIAMSDVRVREKLSLGDAPKSTMHYWGRTPDDQAFGRRSAAVTFGRADGHATLVAVVDLLDNSVTQVVPAEQW